MDLDSCPVSVGTCRVAVCIAHTAMRALIIDLINREHSRWTVVAVSDRASLHTVFAGAPVHLAVVDGADFPAFSRELSTFPLDQVVVIGAEPDPAYAVAALHQGAGAWLPRDRVSEDLSAALEHVLAGTHAHDTPNTA